MFFPSLICPRITTRSALYEGDRKFTIKDCPWRKIYSWDYFIKIFFFGEQTHNFNIIWSNVNPFMCFVSFSNDRLSLKIEPGTSTPRSAASREDLVG